MNNESQTDFFPAVALKRPSPEPVKTDIARKATAPDINQALPRTLHLLWEKLRLHSHERPVKKPALIEYLWPECGGMSAEERERQGYPLDPERTVRTMNDELVEVYGRMVGSGPKGYYAIQDEKSFSKAKTYLLQKKLALEDRVGMLDRNWKILHGALPETVEQMPLDEFKESA